MPKKLFSSFSYLLGIAIASLIIGFSIQLALAAWQEPTAAPPGDNVPAPINVGPDGQVKIGGLKINTGSSSYSPAQVGFVVATGTMGIGIGTTTDPEFKLDIDNDGGIIARGTLNSGAELITTGDGTRLIWYPKKAAFRVGGISNVGYAGDLLRWDNANIGDYSTALGHNTIASGTNSVAIGYRSKSVGDSSIAMGFETDAADTGSVAMGYQTTASGVGAFAAGNGSSALIMGGIAMGSSARSEGSGDSNIALGDAVLAKDGRGSVAMGFNATAAGNGTVGAYAMGNTVEAQGAAAVAIGRLIAAIGEDTMVIGKGVSGDTLTNNTAGSLMIGFNSNIPTLFVGPSSGINTTGSIGVATTTPANNLGLAIAGRVGATEYCDENGNNCGSFAGSNLWTAGAGDDIYNTDFATGNVGIGTTTPSAKLTIVDGAILASGATGATPVSGAGTRMMWVPAKAAFRAGSVSGNIWDNANIGNYSVAMGNNSGAYGDSSIALGDNADTTSSAPGAISMGTWTTANAAASVAMGYGASTNGTYSIAMGKYPRADGEVSIAMGEYVQSVANNAFTIGKGMAGNLLANNIANSLMVGFDSDIPTFFVGPSAGTSTTGNVGIGTTTPPSKLSIDGGGLLITGSTGTTPVSGAGTRMMWVPAKAAFRAGEASSWGSWDDANIGDYSVAMGHEIMASGLGSVAFTGYSTASGDYSVAIGRNNDSAGLYSTAIGYNNDTSGNVSMAFGRDNNVSNVQSMAFGAYNFVSGLGSMAFGTSNNMPGVNSIALGWYNQISSNSSLAMGSNLENTEDNTFILGIGLGVNKLANNISNSLMVGFNSDVPTFFVGPSAGTSTTGNVGIGTTSPQQKLEIDDSSSGAARLRITDTAQNAELQLQYGPDSTNDHWAIFSDQANSDSLNIWSDNSGSPDNRMTIMQNGNVGIGTTDPGAAKLNVAGLGYMKMVMFGKIGASQTAVLDVYNPVPATTVAKFRDNTDMEVMVIQNVGNVGIGTTSPQSKLQVTNGDVYIDTIGSGIILKSPDGNCHRITVDNSNAISASSITCP